MIPRLMPAVTSAFVLSCALPTVAQGYEFPPDLPGDLGVGSAQPAADATTGGGALPQTDLPPALEDAAYVPVADTLGNRFSFGQNATLELETRIFSNQALNGDTRAALRLQAHYFGTRSLGDNLSLLFNLRARTERVETQRYRFEDDFNIDVQELAFNYSLGAQTSIQFGRINIRNGVAAGFNPTDWFRDNSLVLTGSAAAADRRNERLGVFAITGTTTWGQTLVQAGYRPKISASAGSIWAEHDNIGLGLNRTNATEAFFVKAAPNVGDNLSLTANALVLDGNPGVGFELSGSVGDNLVLYSEVMAQKRNSLAADALAGGTGSAAFRAGLGADEQRNWQVQSAIGVNWALPQRLVGMQDISVTLEHHLNTGGLSADQIDTLAGAAGPDQAAAGALYRLANQRQTPLAEQQIFTRLAWNDFWGDSDLAMLAYYVPDDDSGLAQISVNVPIGQTAVFNLRGIHSFGSAQSVYGANPTKRSLQAAMIWRF